MRLNLLKYAPICSQFQTWQVHIGWSIHCIFEEKLLYSSFWQFKGSLIQIHHITFCLGPQFLRTFSQKWILCSQARKYWYRVKKNASMYQPKTFPVGHLHCDKYFLYYKFSEMWCLNMQMRLNLPKCANMHKCPNLTRTHWMKHLRGKVLMHNILRVQCLLNMNPLLIHTSITGHSAFASSSTWVRLTTASSCLASFGAATGDKLLTSIWNWRQWHELRNKWICQACCNLLLCHLLGTLYLVQS